MRLRRRFTRAAWVILPLTVAVAAHAPDPSQRRLPRFEDYPVREVYRGRPAPVDLASAPGAQRFRTVLREGAARGPNFAGRYTVVEWGCGSPCHAFAIVDARTGRVYFVPQTANAGAEYRLDSRLFVIDGERRYREAYGDSIPGALAGVTTFYRWTGTRLVKLDTALVRP